MVGSEFQFIQWFTSIIIWRDETFCAILSPFHGSEHKNKFSDKVSFKVSNKLTVLTLSHAKRSKLRCSAPDNFYWTNFLFNYHTSSAHSKYDEGSKQEIAQEQCKIWPTQVLLGSMNGVDRYLVLFDGKLMVREQNMVAITVCDDWIVNETASERCSDGYFSILDH